MEKRMRIRVSYAFTRLGDAPLVGFTGNVAEKMKTNPNFPTPAIDPDDLQAAAELLQTRIQDAQQGGVMARTLRNQQSAVVKDMLRTQAAYVQSVVGDDLAKLQSSGFEATSSNRARVQLPQPVIRRIYSPTSTVLAAVVGALANARAWEVRIHNGTDEWHSFGGLTSSRALLIPNRVPGQTYTVQVRAIGGLTGYSDWSDPVSHMAT
jgi:hypothetical protein